MIKVKTKQKFLDDSIPDFIKYALFATGQITPKYSNRDMFSVSKKVSTSELRRSRSLHLGRKSHFNEELLLMPKSFIVELEETLKEVYPPILTLIAPLDAQASQGSGQKVL